MLTCFLMGGLGNQIFQIFATISYSIRTRNEFKFLDLKILTDGTNTPRKTYWDSFFHNLRPFLTDELPTDMIIIKEPFFQYNDIPLRYMLNRNTMICGYYQSYKYFQDNYDLICRVIGLEQSKINLLKKLNYINSNNLFDNKLNNLISIHFRIGDYKIIQDVHPIMTKEYYINSLEHIKNKNPETKFKILYFCEDVDIDDVLVKIKYLKEKFVDYEFIRGENSLDDWEQMLLMSSCHHNIIANSSFSWWAAYFNKWSDKIICYPSIWFGEIAAINTKDLCPDEWIKIDV